MSLLGAMLFLHDLPVTAKDSPVDSTGSVGSKRLPPPTSTASRILKTPMTLRLDNYLDIVDSVLSAGVIAGGRELALSEIQRDIATPISIDGGTGTEPRDARIVRKSLLMRASDPGALATRSSNPIDEPLIVTTDMPLRADGAISWPMPTGRLSIVAADGSRIELDADNGDPASADITITNGPERHQRREPWSAWIRRVSTTR